jgi:AmmeMemoRadiSam system protein B
MVPHAGWVFSGATAARVYSVLAETGGFETFLVFGAVHSWGTPKGAVYPEGTWATPLGEMEVDSELAEAVLREGADRVEENAPAHRAEHSIEVQIPFLQHLFPGARLCAINVPPGLDAPEVGRAAARACRELGRNAAVLASSDLTHYGRRFGFAPKGAGEDAHTWMKEVNDRTFLQGVLSLDSRSVLSSAAADHSACGSGAVAAAVAAVESLGASKGVLLEHTTSHEIMPERSPSDFVGYGAVLFV